MSQDASPPPLARLLLGLYPNGDHPERRERRVQAGPHALEVARENTASPGVADEPCKPGLHPREQEIGNDEIEPNVGTERVEPRTHEQEVCPVASRVRTRGCTGHQIHIEAESGEGARPECTEGQDSASRPHVEHRLSGPELLEEKRQSEPGGRVLTRAERTSRIDLDLRPTRGLAPRGPNPERSYASRPKPLPPELVPRLIGYGLDVPDEDRESPVSEGPHPFVGRVSIEVSEDPGW